MKSTKIYVIVLTIALMLAAKSEILFSNVTDCLKQKLSSMPKISADISFLMVDLKYKDGQIKICEFGEGTRSRYKGHDKMFGKGTMWSFFWDYMRQFDMPLFYVGPAFAPLGAQDDKKEIAYDRFVDIGGRCVRTLYELEVNKAFFKAQSKLFKNTGSIFEHKGLVMFRHLDASEKMFQNFRRKNPGFLVLNSASAPYVNNKFFTNFLFQEQGLEAYKPKFMLCEKKYQKDLAQHIKTTLGCTKFVIKPLDDFKGRGVIIVAFKDLDDTLQIILDNKRPLNSKDHYMNMLYRYWRQKNKPQFLVEEYCASQPVEINEKKYDPTMRVVCALHYDKGQMHSTYFDAFWKIPTKALSDKVSLTEKHKSLGTIPLPVSEQDKQGVFKALDECLPKLYEKMIRLINEK